VPHRRVPKNPVEHVLRALVGLGQWQVCGNAGIPPELRIGNFIRRGFISSSGTSLVTALEHGEVWRVGKAVKHRRRRGVHLFSAAIRASFHRAQQARLVVLCADGDTTFRVGAGHISGRAEAADVIRTGLRIILDGEDTGIPPKPACG